MAIPDLLVSRHNGAGGAVFSLSGGTTLTQIGSTFTASVETLVGTSATALGSVIEFKGARYVWHRDEIREENTGGAGTWGVIHTVSNMIASDGYAIHSGLYQMQQNGENILVGLYLNTGGRLGAVTSVDGTAWTQLDHVTAFSNSGQRCGRATVFRNKLYLIIANTTGLGIARFDPQTQALTYIEMGPSSTATNRDLCVFENRLFMVGSSGTGSGNDIFLWRLDGNRFQNVLALNAENDANTEQGGCLLFTDNTNLYVITSGQRASDGVHGDQAFRIETPLGTPTYTEITSAVIPAALQPGGGSGTTQSRWFAYANNTSPGALEHYLWRLPNPISGTYEAYQWQGDASTMTSLGAVSGSFIEGIYLPNTKTGGGERIDASGKVYGQLEDHQRITGGEIQFTYRVYGSGADVTLDLYIDADEETPATQATLTGASGGSSSLSGGSIINVTPDDGVTAYTLTWDAATDGYSVNDVPQLMINLV